jgi:hypothetical protein
MVTIQLSEINTFTEFGVSDVTLDRVLKNRASGRDPALCGFCKCSHIVEYAALSKTLHALADVLMLVFQYPVELPL